MGQFEDLLWNNKDVFIHVIIFYGGRFRGSIGEVLPQHLFYFDNGLKLTKIDLIGLLITMIMVFNEFASLVLMFEKYNRKLNHILSIILLNRKL